jgi:nitrite reductase/ring-hydroxylating ferredoxin subunit
MAAAVADNEEVRVEILTRRSFLGQTVFTGCACAAACLFANETIAAPAPPPGKGGGTPVAGQTDVGPFAAFGKRPDGIYDKFAKAPTAFLIVINEGKVYALSSVCTHKKKLVQTYKEDPRQAYCPTHESLFDIDGTPAALGADGDKVQARSPLPRHGVSVNARGNLVVDTSKTFTYDERDKEGAFVAIEKGRGKKS